ncbi:MAG: O-antigen ligase family protein [Candidatus Saccharimonadales bacterium]
MATKIQKLGVLDKVFVGILLAVFGGIVLHAPLSVGFSTLFPSAEVLIKSWKEILLIIAAIIAVVILTQKKRWSLIKSPVVVLIAIYALLHILLIPVFAVTSDVVLAGLAIDLRYLLFFVLVYIAISMYPQLRRVFVGTFLAGALVVVTFAILQVTVLPHDVLKYIGYGHGTIAPYLTVDENPEFIRISSTLRGPNPLGAYALIVLSLLLAFGLRGHHRQFKRPMFIVGLLGIGGVVALWASYSRSAVVATIIAIVLLLFITAGRRISKWAWISMVIAVLAIGGTIIASRNTYFVSNVLLHENATTGAAINSNEGHVNSLSDGLDRMVHQPLGGGIGSTGSASLFGNQPLIIENQYLFIAHEAGWVGLVLFLVITWKIMRILWVRRADWLALGVFASGVGLLIIGLLLPVLADDTVSLIWWGLAAIVIGGVNERTINKTTKRTA